HCLDKKVAEDIVEIILQNEMYVEVYTDGDYFIQQDQVSDFTQKRTNTLQREPVVVEALHAVASTISITKMNAYAKGTEAKQKAEALFEPFRDHATFSWASNPALDSFHIVNVTAKGISKKDAAIEALKSIGISF